MVELHALGGILIGGCVGLDGDRFALKGGSNLAGGVVAHLRGAVRNGNAVVSLPRLNAQVAASCRFCKRMNARVDQLCILGFAGIVDVFFAVCLCKVNSAHMAARCIVFQDHSTGSGDVGIFGDCSFVITDGNCDILSLVDRQVFRRSTVGTLNGHVTLAGDICAARHSAAVRRKDHFAGIINVQVSVHSHIFVAADIHLAGAVDVNPAINCCILVTGDGHIICTYNTRIVLLSDRQIASTDAAVQNDIRFRRPDLQQVLDPICCRQGLLHRVVDDTPTLQVLIIFAGDRLIVNINAKILHNIVIRDQSHVIARHGKGDCGVHLLLICKRDALSSPAGKLSVFFACSGHGDLFARKGSLQFCTLSLQLDGCIFCRIDVVAHFRRNAHILCRFYWDGHNIRVNCSICCIIGVVTIITSVGNALCNSAVLVLFKKGRRAGAFNYHIATDRRIALAFDLHTCRAVYGKVSANSRPRTVIRYNGQLPGAGNIYIALNRCKFLTGNRHIIRIFNCQDTVKSAILQCKILAIQLYIHARCIDRQESVDGSI